MARRRQIMAGLALSLLGGALATAQTAVKVPRIGVLRTGSPPDPFVEAFREGLHDLGWVEGRNIRLEYRWAEGRDERLAALARELIGLGVDVIVAGGSQAQVARQATTSIPIVMPVANDPVGTGLVASLSRPGGNVTGLAFHSEGLPGKWVELLTEAIPGVSRVAVLWHPPTEAGQLKVAEAAARSRQLLLRPIKVQRRDDLATAFAAAQKERAQAVMILSSPLFYAHRSRLVELAAKHRLPTMYHQREFVVETGGLMSYGPNLRHLFRRAATYVDRILKGAKPAELPIEQPTRFELVVNLRTARALQLDIPRSLLTRADEVIE